jgi:hypothetical protein
MNDHFSVVEVVVGHGLSLLDLVGSEAVSSIAEGFPLTILTSLASIATFATILLAITSSLVLALVPTLAILLSGSFASKTTTIAATTELISTSIVGSTPFIASVLAFLPSIGFWFGVFDKDGLVGNSHSAALLDGLVCLLDRGVLHKEEAGLVLHSFQVEVVERTHLFEQFTEFIFFGLYEEMLTKGEMPPMKSLLLGSKKSFPPLSRPEPCDDERLLLRCLCMCL